MAVLLATSGAVVLVGGIGVAVITLIAMVTIITKAGYSGAWILLPLSLVILWIILIADTFHTVTSFSSFGFQTAKALVIIYFLDVILNWVFFLVFAFSDWPALQAGTRPTYSDAGGGPQRQVHVPPPPSRPQEPGWHQVGSNNNDQAYWDGQTWTARRHWGGAGWTDVPLWPDEPPP
jgi:hypothetical protein